MKTVQQIADESAAIIAEFEQSLGVHLVQSFSTQGLLRGSPKIGPSQAGARALPYSYQPVVSGPASKGVPTVSVTSKTCRKCGITKPATGFYAKASNPDGLASWCKECKSAARKGRVSAPRRALGKTIVTSSDNGYIASRELLLIWETVQAARTTDDPHPLNMFFVGPSGCGKTAGAKYLADVAGLPFVKVDAPSMTDPESWFGTREVVAEDGVSVTTYRPSTFVDAITQPCVLLIDEANRIKDSDRNILLPLLDGTHQITNPLTGELVVKDPNCYVILSGNVGLQFTGTFAVDAALTTRALTVEFTYLAAPDEARVAIQRTGVDPNIANVFVRFANETRQRSGTPGNEDMSPVSTREVIAACLLTAKGLPADIAAQITIMNGASADGGAASVRHRLQSIWAGIRPALIAKP